MGPVRLGRESGNAIQQIRVGFLSQFSRFRPEVGMSAAGNGVSGEIC